ncbi:hypothetical protein [Paraburkholderia saeva]|nr:hypothetical protein [Paraburkholderia saeva]
MMNKILAALLIAISASVAAPAFASGYGPAPFYRPSVGAPASQRGQSPQTVAAEQHGVATSAESYGGVVSTSSESGGRERAEQARHIYAGH